MLVAFKRKGAKTHVKCRPNEIGISYELATKNGMELALKNDGWMMVPFQGHA